MYILEKGITAFKKIPKKLYLYIGIGSIGLILFVYGIGIVLHSNQSRENPDFVDFSQPSAKQNLASDAATLNANTIVVDVEGAVVNPGVYHLPQNGRVQDALVASGGLSGNADRTWVAQHIDLATKLVDGTKIYIPSFAEASTFVETSVDNSAGQAQNQQIDINSASETDLDNLPGVGPQTANKIIAGRPYGNIQDLLDRKIVSVKVFGKIKGLIVAQ